MSDFVRVSLPNGHEATLSAAFVEGTDLQVLDAPATNSRGVPLPATRKNGRPVKPRTTVQKAAKKADPKPDPGPSGNPTTDGVAVKPEEASA